MNGGTLVEDTEFWIFFYEFHIHVFAFPFPFHP